ncbi:MAG: extracellular solute-binding protein [bacterium]|nr:extracellular solute-binding protein [bacterium]
MKRKSIFMLFSLLALLLTFSLNIYAQEGITITVWATGSEDEALVLQAAADLYTASVEGVTIVVEPISWDDGYTRVLAAATSQDGPDIITGGLSWGISFGALGGMVDLAAAYPEAVAAISEVAHPGVWESIVSLDDEVFGVPLDLTTYLTYYRPDLLAELGLDGAPETWEELTMYADTIREANGGEGGFAIQWGNTQWLSFANYLWQAGGDFYDEECSASTINSEEGVMALEFYASLYKEHGFPTDGWPALEAGLNDGLYPIGMTGNWVLGGFDIQYPDLAGKWEVSVAAAGPSGKSTVFIGGRIIGVMSYSANVDAAFDFINFLYTPEAVETITTVAASKSIFWIPGLAEFAGTDIYGATVNEVVQAQLDDAQGPPNCPGWEEAATEVQRLIETTIYEDADAQDVLDEAADIMDELLGL